ncbi:heterokaryon incompatibility protein [Colletotrichum nymphaeae SA-01]|uniref:Heterokaryon incompatibility protein n=1 Tax=Colletotrichum nymphaeae SA-01 TaxID=1460502 RepID=A0A135TXS1_9PEZI|nr:heterokaryon incompatibility protein [Colletotrichum nymphaeae SA-01]
MSRWHERGCSRPDVVVCGGLPCCQFCYAVASIDDVQFGASLEIPQAPVHTKGSAYNLRWPQCVNYHDPYREVTSSSFDSLNFIGPFPPIGEYGSWGPRSKVLKRPNTPPKDCSSTEEPTQKRRRLFSADDLYHPLKNYPISETKGPEIRILELDSGDNGCILHANFRNIQLGSKGAEYEALSYTWADLNGDSARRRPMFIGPYWDVIPITRNCEDALRSIRLISGRFRPIWVDSLCINQENNDECGSQVALMPQIYATAKGVLAYLGLAADGSEKAIRAILNTISHPNCGHNKEIRKACADCEAHIRELLKRPYFRRLWIVQEVFLSKTLTLYCGSQSTPWPFSDILVPLVQQPWMARKGEARTRRSLLNIMVDTYDCLCKDPRDKVFAILGLASGGPFRRVYPDYNLTLEEVSIGIASYFTQQCGLGMLVLLFADAIQTRNLNLPSWVPDIQVPFRKRESIRVLYERLSPTGRLSSSVRPSYNDLLEEGYPMWPGSDGFSKISIASQSGHLQIRAIKLCNVLEYFPEQGGRWDQQAFVRYGPAYGPRMKATLVIPQPLSIGPLEEHDTDVSKHIQQSDLLFWLHGFNGYAVLRLNGGSSTYRLVCACDLSLQGLDDGHAIEYGIEAFTYYDDREVYRQMESILEGVIPLIGSTPPTLEDTRKVLADSFLLKLATYTDRFEHTYRSRIRLWETWKQLEMKLRPYLEDKRGIDLLLKAITAAEPLTLGIEQDGNPRQVFSFNGFVLRSSKAITSLLWSLLPKTREIREERTGLGGAMLPVEDVLRGIQEWADTTSDLLCALAHEAEFEEDSFLWRRYFMHIQQQWLKEMERFRCKMIPEQYRLGDLGTVAYILQLFPLHNARKFSSIDVDDRLEMQAKELAWAQSTRNVLWSWTDLSEELERRWKVWQYLDQHQRLSSWRSGQPSSLNRMDQQMWIRYRLSSLGFDFGLPSDITIQ